MSELPKDCILLILSFNYNFKSDINLIDKECYMVFNKKNLRSKIAKILKWYKKNTSSFSIDYFPDNKISKINLIQILRKKYDRFKLNQFIDYFIKMINRQDLIDYVIHKMKPRYLRTKLEIIEFLKLPIISKDDILFVGLYSFNL